jgi:hypothetical protein
MRTYINVTFKCLEIVRREGIRGRGGNVRPSVHVCVIASILLSAFRYKILSNSPVAEQLSVMMGTYVYTSGFWHQDLSFNKRNYCITFKLENLKISCRNWVEILTNIVNEILVSRPKLCTQSQFQLSENAYRIPYIDQR